MNNINEDKLPDWIDQVKKLQGADKDTIEEYFILRPPGAEIIASRSISDENLISMLKDLGDKRLKEELDELIARDKISDVMKSILKRGFYQDIFEALKLRIEERKPRVK